MTIDRRRFLGALALAPAALAGCTAARAERPAPAAGEGPQRGSRRGAGPVGSAVAAVRAARVPEDAEPAFVFRAVAARPGDVR